MLPFYTTDGGLHSLRDGLDNPWGVPTKPVIATSYEKSFSASASQVHSSYYPILFVSKGLFSFGFTFCSVIADILPFDITSYVRTYGLNPKEIIRSIKPKTQDAYVKLVLSYVYKREWNSPSCFLPPEDKHGIAGSFLDAYMSFIIAHEYSHIMMQHKGYYFDNFSESISTREKKKSANHKKEHQADAMGHQFAAYSTVKTNNGPPYNYIGMALVMYTLMFFDVLALYIDPRLEIGDTFTHPSAAQRLAQLREYYKQTSTMEYDIYGLLNELMLHLQNCAFNRHITLIQRYRLSDLLNTNAETLLSII